MNERYLSEAVGRTLTDVTMSQQPFGAKCVILAEGCRQILPFISRGSCTNIEAASMKKGNRCRFINVFKLTANTTINKDQSLQHLDRWRLKFGNGYLPIARLSDIIHVQPENVYKMLDDCGIAMRESHRRMVQKVFPDINAKLHGPELQWIFWIAYIPVPFMRAFNYPLWAQ